MSDPTSDPMQDAVSDAMPEGAAMHVLKNITFMGDAQNRSVALALTDTNDATAAYAINAAAVRALLPPLLSLAATWAGEPELSPEAVAGPQNALPAKYVHFTRGRIDTEIAIRVFIGKDLDLTFILPLETVLKAFQNFSQHVQFRPKRPN